MEVTDPTFWGGKRVFITGHTGFKGSWLSIWLQEMGAELTGYSLAPPTQPNLYDAAAVGSGMYSVRGDIRDFPALKSSIAEARPEILIHMAAQPLVRRSYEDPIETYATNVLGTVHVLEAVRQLGGTSAVLIVTSDKCYQNNEWVWGYRESDPMGGYDPYSNSKACAELVTAAFRDSFFNPDAFEQHSTAVASVRAGNVVGGGDWAADRLVPDLLKGFAAGEAVPIRYPHAVRPWQHVLEPLSGYLLLAEKLYRNGSKFVGGWNFGPYESDAKSVEWIANRVLQHWGYGAEWAWEGTNHPHEAHYLKLDWSKAHTLLKWSPRWDLDHALFRTVAWYRSYQRDQRADKIRAATVADIRAFQDSSRNCFGPITERAPVDYAESISA
jgi:CDP-glucose 4,6-dehydratase